MSSDVLVQAITDSCAATEADNLTKSFVHLYASKGKALPVLLRYIQQEIAAITADNEGTLFRANSIASKMFKVYSKIEGLPYLWKTLATHVNAIMASAPDDDPNVLKTTGSFSVEVCYIYRGYILSFLTYFLFIMIYLSSIIDHRHHYHQIDPNKVEEGEDEAANKWQLLLVTQKIFTSIVRSLEYMPK